MAALQLGGSGSNAGASVGRNVNGTSDGQQDDSGLLEWIVSVLDLCEAMKAHRANCGRGNIQVLTWIAFASRFLLHRYNTLFDSINADSSSAPWRLLCLDLPMLTSYYFC
jgi:hypothetical protein